MSSLVFAIAVCVVGAVCSATGFVHLVDHGKLREHLEHQQVLSGSMVVPAAIAITAGELSIGALTALFVVGALEASLLCICAMVPALVLFIGFAAYLKIVRSRVGDGNVACGCGVGESVITKESIVRASVLAIIALLAVIGLMMRMIGSGLFREGLLFACLVVLVSLATTLLTIWLPVAFQQERLLEETLT